jgi:hypothetical protein
VGASEDGRILANVLFDASSMVRWPFPRRTSKAAVGGCRRPQAAAGRRLARDIVVEVDASEDGRVLANVLFDASSMVR